MPYYEVKPLQSKPKKILEEVHPLHIIHEVQKWPALYVRDCPERASGHFRAKLWTEVARAVMPDWDTYSTTQKQNRDLVKKWRNLRDTFKRQIQVEKKIRAGHKIKKKTYVYFNHMSFLLPHLEPDDEEPPSPAAPPAPPAARARLAPSAPVPAPAPPVALATEEIDEDHHFLMSLVPSFRRMTDDEKLTAKMEILKVIQNVRGQNRLLVDTDALASTSEIDIKEEMLIDIGPDLESNFECGNNNSSDDGGGDDSD